MINMVIGGMLGGAFAFFVVEFMEWKIRQWSSKSTKLNCAKICVCVNCGLAIEPDEDGWGHVDAAEPFDSTEHRRFLINGCADPRPKEGHGNRT